MSALALALSAPSLAPQCGDLTRWRPIRFQNTLAADQSGGRAPPGADPLSQNSFQTATLYGQTRQVYEFSGNATPVTDQAGLSLDTTGLIAPNLYSVEIVFQFFDRDNAWRRIADGLDRTSDSGFYVDPSNNLDIFPVAGSTAVFTNNAFHDVVLTVAADNTVNAYLDGALEFTTTTTVMDINNPGNLMNFFLDNVVGGGQGEYSSGQIGLINLFNGVLGVRTRSQPMLNPFGTPSVPEPSSVALMGLGAAGLLGMVTRRRRATADLGR